MRSTIGRPPTTAELAPLWVEPAGREAFYGSGGSRHAPRPDVVYKLHKRESGGFSPKLEVIDPDGVKWSVKLGDEAQSEVTSSRIVWAVGYQQPPGYYLEHWRIQDETGGVHHMGPGRFRPHLEEFKSRGSWGWHSNPFVDAVQFRGLIVLMMILNSTDLKDVNNEIYRVRLSGRPAIDWYTVKDLGASLGQTGRVAPKRNNIDFFEKQAFVTGQENGFVRFEFHGRHQELLRHIRPADVRWICERLRGLSPQQWHDAFRAGGYDEATTARYLRKIDEKIAQGLTLEAGARR